MGAGYYAWLCQTRAEVGQLGAPQGVVHASKQGPRIGCQAVSKPQWVGEVGVEALGPVQDWAEGYSQAQ